jgi:hypothetical protein
VKTVEYTRADLMTLNHKECNAAELQPKQQALFYRRGTEFPESEYFFIKNFSLGALRASAFRNVADPSFGGSAVSSLLNPYNQRTTKTFAQVENFQVQG